MMNAKETIKNNILVAMRIYLDSTTMQILEAVINKSEAHTIRIFQDYVAAV